MKKRIRLTESELIKLVKQIIQEQNILDYKSNTEECFVLDFYFEKTTGGETNVNGDKEWDGGDLHFWNDNKIPEVDDEEAYNRFIEHIKDAAGYEPRTSVHPIHPEMILNEDCFDYDNPPSWEELLPYIKEAYYNTLRKKKLESQIQSLQSPKDAISLAKQIFADNKSKDSLLNFVYNLSKEYNFEIPAQTKRRLSDAVFTKYLYDIMAKMTLENYDDEFNFAEHALQYVIIDYYDELVKAMGPNTDAEDEFYDYIKDEYGDIALEYFIDSMNPDYDDDEL